MDLGELGPHMARCFELAWQSCAAGTIGVGARLVGEDGSVLADGSNGLFADAVGPLRGNKIAHAEMNALAQIDAATDLTRATLYTSLEPCFMCAGAVLLSRVGRVEVAARDPYMEGASALPTADHGMTDIAERVFLDRPEWTVLSRVFSLHAVFFWMSGSDAVASAHSTEPKIAPLVAELVVDNTVAALAEAGAGVEAAIDELAPKIAAALG
ncbi:MAG: nucleoside deaminase [Actinomycetota bacterium]